MALREGWALAAAATGGLGTIVRDAIGDLPGRDRHGDSLPFAPDAVLTPATLNRLLARDALPALAGRPRITAVRRLDVPSVSSNCENHVIALQQDGPPVLPDTVFVKLPMRALATRWFFSVIGSWRLESQFFRHVAPGLPIRTPLTYATAARGSRFYLIQENLRADPSVQLFTSLDMFDGPSLPLVERCLDTFARLHAAHAGLTARQREALLPRESHVLTAPRLAGLARTLNRLALAPCMRKRPGAIPADVADVYRRSIAHWDRLSAFWFAEPVSLLHGDSHLGNFFVSGDTMGLLDWQAAHWGKGIRDVQYFLTDSLPADVLAGRERDLIAYYCERRAQYGAPVDIATTWQEYRSFTFHTLFTIVVSIGFGALNAEQDALMAEVLDRAVAAVQRVDYAGWLADFLAD